MAKSRPTTPARGNTPAPGIVSVKDSTMPCGALPYPATPGGGGRLRLETVHTEIDSPAKPVLNINKEPAKSSAGRPKKKTDKVKAPRAAATTTRTTRTQDGTLPKPGDTLTSDATKVPKPKAPRAATVKRTPKKADLVDLTGDGEEKKRPRPKKAPAVKKADLVDLTSDGEEKKRPGPKRAPAVKEADFSDFWSDEEKKKRPNPKKTTKTTTPAKKSATGAGVKKSTAAKAKKPATAKKPRAKKGNTKEALVEV